MQISQLLTYGLVDDKTEGCHISIFTVIMEMHPACHASHMHAEW